MELCPNNFVGRKEPWAGGSPLIKPWKEANKIPRSDVTRSWQRQLLQNFDRLGGRDSGTEESLLDGSLSFEIATDMKTYLAQRDWLREEIHRMLQPLPWAYH